MNYSLIIQLTIVLVFCTYLYIDKKLTLGALSLGIINVALLAYFGGTNWLSMFLFSTLVSLLVPKIVTKKDKNKKGTRNWKDMLAISSATCSTLFLSGISLVDTQNILLFSSALSYITADIFSSEIRLSFWKSKARLISKGFIEVEHGVSGAVSIAGFLYALLGSIFVGLLYFINERSLYGVFIIVITGFIICFLESLFNDYKIRFKWNVSNELTNILFVLSSVFVSFIIKYFLF